MQQIKQQIAAEVEPFLILDIAKMIADFTIGDTPDSRDIITYDLMGCIHDAPSAELMQLAMEEGKTHMMECIYESRSRKSVDFDESAIESAVKKAPAKAIIQFMEYQLVPDKMWKYINMYNRADVMSIINGVNIWFYVKHAASSCETRWLSVLKPKIGEQQWYDLAIGAIQKDDAIALQKIIDLCDVSGFVGNVLLEAKKTPRCTTCLFNNMSEIDIAHLRKYSFWTGLLELAECYRFLRIEY